MSNACLRGTHFKLVELWRSRGLPSEGAQMLQNFSEGLPVTQRQSATPSTQNLGKRDKTNDLILRVASARALGRWSVEGLAGPNAKADEAGKESTCKDAALWRTTR